MLDRTQTAALGALMLWMAGCAHLPPGEKIATPFRFENDRLGFANETVWNYVDGKPQPERDEDGDKEGDRYTRRCFVVARSALQFWKFARFRADQPALSDEELARRIRKVASIDTWKDPLPESERIVFPGYANLKEISSAKPKVFQEHLGLGWPVYFRVGNFPMIIPPTSSSQEKIHGEVSADLAQGYPSILWLINFPSLSINHAVLVYRQRQEGENTVYTVYDPNYIDEPKELTYCPADKTFRYVSTFYFEGGEVDVRPLYRSYVQ